VATVVAATARASISPNVSPGAGAPLTKEIPVALTLQEIQQKSAVDSTFRASLLADPKAALASVGLDVPDGITVDVIEAGYNRLPIVLPPVQSGELSDEALAGMVGGAAQAVSGSEFITNVIGT
jgi:hypothetical protein